MEFRPFDNTPESATRHIIPLNSWDLPPILWTHVSTSGYLVSENINSERIQGKLNDKVFLFNNSIWEEVIMGNLRRSDSRIILNSFFIFEWFPRSPGLYFTPDGKRAREEAKRHISSFKDGSIVYDPYGKLSMLDGGVGNVRFKPIFIEGVEYYFMSASSNGNCHEGFPIAIPASLYNIIIEEIVDRGVVLKNLVGNLKTTPEKLEDVYKGYRRVPQCFLEVHDLLEPSNKKSRRMEDLGVSVAVSFVSKFEGESKVYATYVTFDPSNRSSFYNSIDWMEEEYVLKNYKGRIITDFDQTVNNFSNATFSLDKVMNLELKESDVYQIEKDLDIKIPEFLKYQGQLKILIQTKEVYMDSKYKITGGQQGAVGDNAKAENFTQQQVAANDVNIDELVSQLSILRQELKKEASNLEHDEQIGIVAAAESAAKKGDKSKAIELLKSAGRWTFDIATKIGTTVAAAIIKEAIIK